MAFAAETAFDYLKKSHANNRLAHAYLITGPEGSGKRDLAARIIGMVNDMDSSRGLDGLVSEFVRLVQPESKSRKITVEQIRSLEKTFYMGGSGAKTKVGVIAEADRMMAESENAFLKTLEEPPANCLLLLVTSAPEMLLDTILSRCIQVPLIGDDVSGLRSEQAVKVVGWLNRYFEKGPCSMPRSLGLARFFSNFLKEMKEGFEKEQKELLKKDTAEYSKTTEGDWLKRREVKMDALAASRYLQRRNALIEVLVSWFGDALRQKSGYGRLDFPEYAEMTAKIAGEMPEDELQRRMEAAVDLRELLNTNVQEILALEVCFMKAFG
jgi:DNA polymerase-3 subunit delta'